MFVHLFQCVVTNEAFGFGLCGGMVFYKFNVFKHCQACGCGFDAGLDSLSLSVSGMD